MLDPSNLDCSRKERLAQSWWSALLLFVANVICGKKKKAEAASANQNSGD